MLIVNVKQGQKVYVGESYVMPTKCRANGVQLGLDFPKSVRILRGKFNGDGEAVPVEAAGDAELAASYHHLDEMMKMSDGRNGLVLYWHGWAIKAAFQAGAEWERNRTNG